MNRFARGRVVRLLDERCQTRSGKCVACTWVPASDEHPSDVAGDYSETLERALGIVLRPDELVELRGALAEVVGCAFSFADGHVTREQFDAVLGRLALEAMS